MWFADVPYAIMEEEVVGSLVVVEIQRVVANPLAFALCALNVLIRGNDVGFGLIDEGTKLVVTDDEMTTGNSFLGCLNHCIYPC